jgi:hypothetical protein
MERRKWKGIFMRKERCCCVCDGAPHTGGCHGGGAEEMCPLLVCLPEAERKPTYEIIYNWRWRYYKGRDTDFKRWAAAARINERVAHFVFDRYGGWRRWLWSQMRGLPVFPQVGRLSVRMAAKKFFANPARVTTPP